MNWEDVFKIITAVITSVGAAGVIIFGLSNWLGKVWASRILEREKNVLNKELEATKRELDVYKETYMRSHNDKIVIYRAVVDVVSKILSTFDSLQSGRTPIEQAAQAFDSFNEQRMQTYGYLAMLAPQSAMDAHDNFIDHLIKISGNEVSYEWAEVRGLAIKFINEVRIDIGIDKTPISYNGDM
ncbi:hypothetical protein [uncultured Ferrimonas sp.]|uniref:hypothetical protein n=1 Tax=uncultured Ferrimonas sp. TaxID=432640 RepID=UPI0026233D2F|nr:hypothetical protein [uncultured Ferrimonas sp.]